MVTVRIPKRVPVELMRSKLGDARAQKLLTEMFGDKLVPVVPLRLRRESLEQTIALLTDAPTPGNGSFKWALVPTIFRAYFAEHPQARGKFTKWMREKLEVVNLEDEAKARVAGNGHPQQEPAKRKRRKAKGR